MKRENKCVYCGDWANTLDHIIPISYLNSNKRNKVSNLYCDSENIVESCTECNCIANDRVFDSIEEKRAYIQNRLSIKYSRLLKLPLWTKEEIKEMGWKFRNELKISALAKKWITNRINYPYVVYEEQIDDDTIKKILKVYSDDITE